MTIRLLTTAADLAAYDSWVTNHPQGNLWQSLTWKRFQEARGREVRIYAALLDEDAIRASALVVIDRTTGGWSTWDCPRGPLGRRTKDKGLRTKDLMRELLQIIMKDAQQDRGLSIYFSPTIELETLNSKLVTSHRHEQPEATRIIDLTPSEEQILAQMHPKGRYNIKVAQKNGVIVERSDDADTFAKLAQETAKRDGFRALSAKHYRAFLEKVEGSFLLIVSAPLLSPRPPLHGRGGDKPRPSLPPMEEGDRGDGGIKPIAALIGVIHGKTGIYYYGASDYTHRALMAPYALQWEAMKYCKEQGCEKYDLLGIAPAPTPDPSPAGRGGNHPWAGVTAFKEKFGGSIVTYSPEQEITLRPMLQRLLYWKRKIWR